jgi:hypothetical protein
VFGPHDGLRKNNLAKRQLKPVQSMRFPMSRIKSSVLGAVLKNFEFFLNNIFCIFLYCFDVKNSFFKMKKLYFNVFISKKHFEPSPLL